MPRTTFLLAGLGLLGALAGCQSPDEPLRPGFGNAVRHNMSMHIINPEPASPDMAVHETQGIRAAGAMERYDTRTVEPLEVVKTTESGGN